MIPCGYPPLLCDWIADQPQRGGRRRKTTASGHYSLSMLCEDLRDGFLLPAGAPSRLPFDHEVFQKELTFATLQRATARDASYFAIDCRLRRGFNTNDFVFCRTIGATEL